MRLMLLRFLVLTTLSLSLTSWPAFAQSGGPLSASSSRMASQSTLSPPTNGLQHYRPACGNKILRGLMIGAGAGAAWGMLLTTKLGEPAIIPSVTVLFGAVGAGGAYHLCR